MSTWQHVYIHPGECYTDNNQVLLVLASLVWLHILSRLMVRLNLLQ